MTAAAGTEEFAANLALAHIGKGEIALMSEPGKKARVIRQHFPVVRDALLRKKWWNFAKAWHQPALDLVPGIGTFTKRYPMPADCIAVRFVQDADDESWEIESGVAEIAGIPVEAIVLVTNFDAPNVCYTRRVEAVRIWDALFLDAFGHKLAAAIATKLGRSQATSRRQDELGDAKAETAASIDSRESSYQRTRREPSILAARRGYRSRSYR